MEKTTGRIAAFAAELRYEDLPQEVVHGAKQRLIDTIACGMGALDCEVAGIGRRIAAPSAPAPWQGRVLGSGDRMSAQDAAFVNSCLTRYLDFNDTWPGGHPSDGIGGLLALADHPDVTPRRFLSGIVVLYEIAVRTATGAKLREIGWDQGFNTAVSIAAAAGHMLGLSVDKIAHAVSIAAVTNNHLRATRAGNLSMWKGAAAGFAARNGVYTAQLAAEGMTGPESPFEGRHGLKDQVYKDFQLAPLPNEGGDYITKLVRLKYWPVEYNAQIGVWAALELRQKMPLADLASVDIGTYWSAWHEIGSEPAKWDPKDRETADHSLPYIFAVTLRDGKVSVASFDHDAVLDPALRPLMARISVREDQEVQAAYPSTVGVKVKATDTSGKVLELYLKNPRGHEKNPMTEDETAAKFHLMADSVLGKGGADKALTALWTLETATSLGPVFDLLAKRG